MKSLVTALLGLGVAAFSVAPSAGLAPTSGEERPSLVVSGSGRPLLHASAMAPGAVVRKTVAVANRGGHDGTLTLAIKVGVRGESRHDLADVLRIRIADRAGRVLAAESLSHFRSRSLIRLRAGEQRELSVDLRMLHAAGNRHAGSRTRFDLAWTLAT